MIEAERLRAAGIRDGIELFQRVAHPPETDERPGANEAIEKRPDSAPAIKVGDDTGPVFGVDPVAQKHERPHLACLAQLFHSPGQRHRSPKLAQSHIRGHGAFDQAGILPVTHQRAGIGLRGGKKIIALFCLARGKKRPRVALRQGRAAQGQERGQRNDCGALGE